MRPEMKCACLHMNQRVSDLLPPPTDPYFNYRAARVSAFFSRRQFSPTFPLRYALACQSDTD